ncbi:hypothetical protein PAXRUDRAFT_83431, partial [Paxillus rubicundulus Ve08.2h10]
SEITLEELEHEAVQVWEGSERDWQCVRRLLRHLGRDGRKLELWRMWLGPYAGGRSSDVKGKGRQLSPDGASSEKACQGPSDAMAGNPPPLGDAVLQSFVFPDSRAQFIDLVKRAGLTGDAGHALTTSGLDFWSYSTGL